MCTAIGHVRFTPNSDIDCVLYQYGREAKEPLEWLAWRKDRRREEHELLLDVMRKQV